MNDHRRMASIFWIVVGVYISIAAYRLGLGRLHKPGPGFIFLISGLFLTILSIVDLAKNFIKSPKADNKEKEAESIWRGFRWHKVLLVLGGMVIYIYFLNMLGFLLSTFLLMFFLYKAVEPTRWWVAILSSLITTLVSYGLFKVWLRVPFPSGILEF